ncbi:MAG: DUF6792 domain-containing protein [Pseudomonadales bacterium]
MRIFVIALIALTFTGCGTLNTWRAKDEKYNKHTPHDSQRPGAQQTAALYSDQFAQDIASRFGFMALLSELVYLRHLSDERDIATECSAHTSSSSEKYRYPPLPSDNLGKWQRWRPGLDSIRPCLSVNGLFYDTFVYTNNQGLISQAVIAYRGTENRRGEYLADWSANTSAFFGIEPTQYKLARAHLPNIIHQLKLANNDIVIYATGHSLGGGLAQQAGYLSRDIQEVITFNTSPVTNWTSLRLNRLVDNEYPTIYRLYHGGEVLEKLRFITSNATSARYGRHDIGVQFEPRSNFDGHSMQVFSCAFAKLITQGDQQISMAAHHYSAPYIEQYLINKGQMCANFEASKIFR